MDCRYKYKIQSYKTFRSEIREYFYNLGLGMHFLVMTLKTPYMKEKVNWLDFIQIKNFFFYERYYYEN